MLDGGRSLSPAAPVRSDGERDQRRAKARAIAQSFAAAGIDAMALGEPDWSLGSGWVRELVATEKLPVLAANLVCGGTAPFPASLVREQAGVRVGIVGVTLGEVEGCEVSDPREALIRAAAELPPVDVRIAMVPVPDDRALATVALPTGESAPLPFDLLLDARNRPPDAVVAERARGTWLSGGSGHKKLGFLELSTTPGATAWRVEGSSMGQSQSAVLESRRDTTARRLDRATDDVTRGRLEAQIAAYDQQIAKAKAEEAGPQGPANVVKVQTVDVQKSVAEEPRSKGFVDAAKAEVTRLAGQDARTFVPRVVLDQRSPFAGGEACARCHDQEHAQWSTTGHARAWQGLADGDRAFDDACWRCHVTGADQAGGPAAADATAGFRDVQCEACHGASRDHVGDPKVPVPTARPAVGACTGCHDGAQDQGRFDAATYLPKVVHMAAASP